MGYDRYDRDDVTEAVRLSALPNGGGMLLSTCRAVEELRILTGDFVTADEDMANEISKVALNMGCAIVFDEQAGAHSFPC